MYTCMCTTIYNDTQFSQKDFDNLSYLNGTASQLQFISPNILAMKPLSNALRRYKLGYRHRTTAPGYERCRFLKNWSKH